MYFDHLPFPVVSQIQELPLTERYRAEETGHSYSGWRADPNPLSPGSPSTIAREHYTYPSVSSNVGASHLAYSNNSIAYAATPRSGEPPLLPPYTPATSVYDDMPSNAQEQSHMFPWSIVEHERSLQTSAGDVIKPNIHAVATKGFFTAQGHWTCYRRNYFALNAWYDLGYMTHQTALFVDGHQVKAFAMHLSATIEGQESKYVELVQYTPKRDLGQKTPIVTTKVSPSAPLGQGSMSPAAAAGAFINMSSFPLPGILGFPYLPLQHEREPDSADSPVSPSQTSTHSTRSRFPASNAHGQHGPHETSRHSFDRIQFKGATQNNGKRRASQQFYILIVELLADVRPDDAKQAEWTRVSMLPSEKLVVRGRSPSHYKDSDGRVNGGHNARGGHQSSYNGHGHHGSSGGGHGGPPSYNASTGNTGAFRPAYAYSNHSSTSPTSSYSATSPSCNSDIIIDAKHHAEPNITREELSHMQSLSPYRYYVEPMYDGMAVLPKIESPTTISLPGVASLERPDSKFTLTDEYPNAVPGRHYNRGTYSYIGSDASTGWYPNGTSNEMY